MSTNQIIKILGSLSQHWLNSKDPYRIKAICRLVSDSKLSPEMSEALIDSIFQELTPLKLKQLLMAELGDPLALDRFVYDDQRKALCRAVAPSRMTFIFSSNGPAPAIHSIIYSLLIKSQSTIKLSSQDDGICHVYLQSLRAASVSLARQVRVLSVSEGKKLEPHLLRSDAVVAYGSDDTMKVLRSQCGAKTRFFGYGHRTSFSYYAKEVMTSQHLERLAKNTAKDIWMLDQRGCLSPMVIYVEKGGAVKPAELARCLAIELQKQSTRDRSFLRRDKSAIAQKTQAKQNFLARNIKNKHSFFIESTDPGQWIIFYEERALEFAWSCGHQTITVCGIRDARAIEKITASMTGFVQAVALEATGKKHGELALRWAKLGASRIACSGKLQLPPALWMHEGRPRLGDWLIWSSIEAPNVVK